MRRTLAVIALLAIASVTEAAPTKVVNFELGATELLGSTAGVIVDGELESPTWGAIGSGFCERPCEDDTDCATDIACDQSRLRCVNANPTTCDHNDDCASNEDCVLPFTVVQDPEPYSRFQVDMSVERGRAATLRADFTGTSRSLDCFDYTLRGHCSGNSSKPCVADHPDCDGSGTCVLGGNGGIGSGQVPIFGTESSGGVRQCIATIGCDYAKTDPSTDFCSGVGTDSRQRSIRIFWNNEDQFECEESFTDGSSCTHCNGNVESCAPSPLSGQCPAEEDGVPKCSSAMYAKLIMTIGERRHICLETKNVLSTFGLNVECKLYTDSPVTIPNKGSIEVGGGVRPQGVCAGGTEAGKACNTQSDCAGTGVSCTNPDGVANAARFRFGVFDANKAQQDTFGYIDNYEHFDLATTPGDLQDALDRRWLTSDIAANAGTNTCDPTGCAGGSHFDCINDNDEGDGWPDAESTRLVCTGNQIETFTHDTWPSPSSGTLETDAWIAVTAAVKENNNGAHGVDKTISYGIIDGGSGPLTASFNLDAVTPDDDYHALPAAIFSTAPGGGTITSSSLNALDLYFKHVGGTGNSPKVAFTSAILTVAYNLPSVVKAQTIQDFNLDGLVTACYFNDSRWNGDDIGVRFVEDAAIIKLDNIIGMAAGGRRCGDFLAHVTELADATSSYKRVYRGSAGHPCDVIFADCGVNDWSEAYPREGYCSQPWCSISTRAACAADADCSGGEKCRIGQCVLPCAIDSECPSGTCGGPEETDACNIPEGYKFKRLEAAALGNLCFDGKKYGTSCASQQACQFCSNSSSTTCTSDSQCSGGGTCVKPDTTAICQPWSSGWCRQFDTYTSPGCPNGMCLQRQSQAYVRDTYRSIISALDARSGSSDVRIVIAPTYPPDSDQHLSWSCNYAELRPYAVWQRALADTLGFAYVDQQEWLRKHSPTGHVDYYLKWDFLGGVHPNPTEGQPLIGELFAKCLRAEHDPAFDCRPILKPCTTNGDCLTGTTCQDWPVGSQDYCQIAP